MVYNKDMKHKVVFAHSIKPAVIKSTATGDAVDCYGYESVTVIVYSGTVTDGTHTWKLTECDTSGGSYTDVDAADLLGSFAVVDSSHDETFTKVGYIGQKRYIKVVNTVTGSPSTGGPMGAIVMLAYPMHGGPSS